MIRTTVCLSPNLKEKLNDYCDHSGKKSSDAIRYFIELGLEQYEQKQQLGYEKSIGKQSLMLNESRSIRASIETLFLLRELVNDKAVVDKVAEFTVDKIKSGWHYDSE